jgi:hypothetical protein
MPSNSLIPIVVSIFSLSVSLFIAGWTVYKDVVRKPRFRVSASIKNIFVPGSKTIGPDLYVEALNMGPSENRIGLCFARPSFFDRKVRRKMSAFIASDTTHLGNTAASQRVAVGDSVSFVFPINELSWGLEEFNQIGVSDGFGTVHWISRKAFSKTRSDVFERLKKNGINRPEKLGRGN